MLPLNMAILEQFTDGKEASRKEIKEALAADYKNFRAFTDKGLDAALQTACSNGLIAETGRLEEDEHGLLVYYKSDQEAIDGILSYIG